MRRTRPRTAAASGPGTRRTRPTSAAAKPTWRSGPSFTSDRPAYKACNVAATWDGTAWHVMRLPGAARFPAGYDHLNRARLAQPWLAWR